jgi:Fic family protein
MDADAFTKPSGELKPLVGGGLTFIPAPLPPARLDMARLAVPVSEALQALGELKGAARRLANPWLLIQPIQRAEALSTSAMEGTFTTMD